MELDYEHVMSLALTIASASARNVWSDSSFRLLSCVLSSGTKIERADLIWCSNTPPILLAVEDSFSTGSIDHHASA